MVETKRQQTDPTPASSADMSKEVKEEQPTVSDKEEHLTFSHASLRLELSELRKNMREDFCKALEALRPAPAPWTCSSSGDMNMGHDLSGRSGKDLRSSLTSSDSCSRGCHGRSHNPVLASILHNKRGAAQVSHTISGGKNVPQHLRFSTDSGSSDASRKQDSSRQPPKASVVSTAWDEDNAASMPSSVAVVPQPHSAAKKPSSVTIVQRQASSSSEESEGPRELNKKSTSTLVVANAGSHRSSWEDVKRRSANFAQKKKDNKEADNRRTVIESHMSLAYLGTGHQWQDETEEGDNGIRKFKIFVDTVGFDIASGSAVILNAVWIGIQTDWYATNEGSVVPSYFQITDSLFCVLFVGELICRMLADGRYFLPILGFLSRTWRPGWYWNAFDSVLVAFQIMEEFMSRLVDGDGTANLSFLRIMRILRLVRVVRLVRLVRLIGELKTILSSIFGSLRSLMWTLVLLLMFMYVIGIFFTQVVMDYSNGDQKDDEVLKYYYGSLPRSVLSLFEAFTGGADWDHMAHALIQGVHPTLGLVFAFYIAFAVLAMMNVVTGVFVENALAQSRKDQDVELITCLSEVFTSNSNFANEETITKGEFDAIMADFKNASLLEAMNIAIPEAEGLFQLIDVECTGEISRNEFIMGCLRLKGPAKAFDLETLMYDIKRLAFLMEEQFNMMETHLYSVLSMLTGTSSRQPASPVP